ncbi:hypothetical protein WG904_03045 [Pedobacter sp. Du54]|uniref:hypothetical protein n=1 Tax=Pedobacter anseongensis TaxID=3133439 RepID=UPI0030952E20
MTTTNNFTSRPINRPSLIRRMLIGAGIGLILITLLVTSANHPNPEWGKFWMIRPLLVVPIFGAAGGLGTYFMEYLLGYQGGWSKIISIVLSIIGFVISIWLGTVLGCAGTLWN